MKHERLVPQDVVAIEYYDLYQKVPENLQRYAWPKESMSPCALIVYWLRKANTNVRSPRDVDAPEGIEAGAGGVRVVPRRRP